MTPSTAQRHPALLALAIPVLAGIGWQAVGGAPNSYLMINAMALAAGSVLILWGRTMAGHLARHRRATMVVLLILFALPLLTGPSLNGIARWLPLPLGFNLHSGMLLLPLTVTLAAGDRTAAPIALGAGLLVSVAQPDAASAAALTFAAFTLAAAWRSWPMALVAAAGIAALALAMRHGELPPQPFVERVIEDAMRFHPVAGIILIAAQITGLLLILLMRRQPQQVWWALCGSLTGFTILAAFAPYPVPLLGYGAAPILGYALALALPDRKTA